MIKIISVVGTRPNFVKIAPIIYELNKFKNQIIHKVCHTGQHYDYVLSNSILEDLNIQKPDFQLGIESNSGTKQIANMMVKLEKLFINEKPNYIIVVGDVNTTLVASIIASKLNIKIIHIESGLRSNDISMQEEKNRIIVDHLSSMLFVTEKSGIKNLIEEEINENKIFLTGNIILDNIRRFKDKIQNSNVLEYYKLKEENYILSTFHRPSNVDNEHSLIEIINILNELAYEITIVFPIHPRTKKRILEFKLHSKFNNKNIKILDSLGYIDFMALMKNSKLVITDSGGVQEETTYLKKQCITVRKNTERPVTIEIGTNKLISLEKNKIIQIVKNILNGKFDQGSVPNLWDGHTAKRIINIILKRIEIDENK